jgi:hypothetical protein
MTLLNELPTIIDEAGTYLTRSGDTVRIHEVKQNSNPETTSFDANGTVRYLKDGNVRYTQKFNIWHVSGRLFLFSISEHDIVSKKMIALQ